MNHLRTPVSDDLHQLAQLWHDGWHDAHAAHVPHTLTALRTIASFRERLPPLADDTRVVGPLGQPAGFCTIQLDELYQIYVAEAARGCGIAARLLSDGEARLAARDVEIAWLACAVGNERAARFYEKNGWRLAGTIIQPLDTSEGQYPLEVLRYEKAVGVNTAP